jgi:protocatechuate 3,4-dioxygenase beta subunit
MRGIDRRRFIRAASAVAGAGMSGMAMAQGGDGRAAITKADQEALARQRQGGTLTCVQTPESVDGPYYYPSSLARPALAEGRKGVRVRLGITIANAVVEGDTCSPLPAAVVDVWHADAEGQYSNVGTGLQRTLTVGATFCRGHQVTDDSGYVEFDTIVPGWEFVETPAPPGVVRRTTHIHVKVFSDFKVTTTQLYFPDDYMNELYAGVQPYTANRSMEAPGSGRRYDRITNAEDREFLSSQSRPMSLERTADGIVAKATIGLVTLGTRRLQTLFR